MQTTKNQNMAGTKVQTSKVWKCLIFPDLARFSGETGSSALGSDLPACPTFSRAVHAREFSPCAGGGFLFSVFSWIMFWRGNWYPVNNLSPGGIYARP